MPTVIEILRLEVPGGEIAFVGDRDIAARNSDEHLMNF